MTCENCVYKGIEFDYLRGHRNIDQWINCLFPKPFFYTSQATPFMEDGKIIEHKCECYEGKYKTDPTKR